MRALCLFVRYTQTRDRQVLFRRRTSALRRGGPTSATLTTTTMPPSHARVSKCTLYIHRWCICVCQCPCNLCHANITHAQFWRAAASATSAILPSIVVRMFDVCVSLSNRTDLLLPPPPSSSCSRARAHYYNTHSQTQAQTDTQTRQMLLLV